MKVLGVAVRVDGGAYLVGFSVVEDEQLLEEHSFAAPKDLIEAGQLHELFGRTVDLLAESKPDRVGFAVNELQASGKAKIANRAEGALLAALGESALLVDLWTGPRLRATSGYSRKGGSSAKAREKLCRDLNHKPGTDENLMAAAAARATILVV